MPSSRSGDQDEPREDAPDVEIYADDPTIIVGDVDQSALAETLSNLNEGMRELKAGLDAVLGIEGIRSVITHALGESIDALAPLRALQPESYELKHEVSEALLKIRAAMERPNFNGFGRVTADTEYVGFIGEPLKQDNRNDVILGNQQGAY